MASTPSRSRSCRRRLPTRQPDVRANGVRLSEHWLADANSPMAAAVLKLEGDPSWTVRRQLAASIGELPAAARLEPAAAMLTKYGSDPILVDVTISGLKGQEAEVLNRVLQPNIAAGEADAVGMLTAAMAKSGDLTHVQAIVARATDPAVPAWERTALLQGLDTGLPARAAGPRRPRRRGRWPRGGGAGQAGVAARRAGGPGRAGERRPMMPARWPSASSRSWIGRASRCRSSRSRR